MSCAFSLRDFLLDIENPKILVKSRWRVFGPRCYVAYRIILAAYCLATLVIFIWKSPKYTFIFFTNWGYTIMTLNFIVKAIVVLKYFYWLHTPFTDIVDDSLPLLPRLNIQDEPLPSLLQFSWLLSNISTTTGITISLVFWIALFPNKGMLLDFENIQAHAINSVLLLLDLMISCKPRRMAHVYQPLTFGLMYLSFTSFYWAAGGWSPFGTRTIYPFIKWDDGVITSLGSGAVFVTCTLVHCLVVGLAKLRDCGFEKELGTGKNNYGYGTVHYQTEL